MFRSKKGLHQFKPSFVAVADRVGARVQLDDGNIQPVEYTADVLLEAEAALDVDLRLFDQLIEQHKHTTCEGYRTGIVDNQGENDFKSHFILPIVVEGSKNLHELIRGED